MNTTERNGSGALQATRLQERTDALVGRTQGLLREKIQVVVSNIYFFSLLLGEMIQFDDHIFPMGWFNHHLGIVGFLFGW